MKNSKNLSLRCTQIEESGVSLENRVSDRKKEFAKVFCLQYRWSEALPYLRRFQTQNQKAQVFIPELVNVSMSSKDSKVGYVTQTNLDEAAREIKSLSQNEDAAIFWNLLAYVDWEKVSVSGKSAIQRRNPELWQFLNIEPYFSKMDKNELKKYIEWSGVIYGQEPSGTRLTSEVAETPIEALDLSENVYNSLKQTGITTVGDVLDLLGKGDAAVVSIRNFGENSLDALAQKMVEKGYLRMETQDSANQLNYLTPREIEVLQFMVEGLTNKQIAEAMKIVPATVARYVSNILRKLNVGNRTQAVNYAIKAGMLSSDQEIT